MKLLAKTLQGLEEILADELADLGAKSIQILRRAVQFEGNLRMIYRANLECRTAIRILMPIAEFKANNEEELYRQNRKIN